jgi:ATP-dependent protease ClpP protease subunit
MEENMKDLNWTGIISNGPLEDKVETSLDSSGDDSNVVSVVGNKIYFYSEVTRTKVLELNRSIVKLGNQFKVSSDILGNNPAHIKLHINSYGGSVFSGFSAVDYIRSSKVPVTSIIDGCAASAATIMSVVAQERFMQENSFMLIHQLSSMMWGKYAELKDDMTNNDQLMAKIKGIYEQHTKIPKKELDKLLSHDLWWDAKKCLRYGMIDGIITP